MPWPLLSSRRVSSKGDLGKDEVSVPYQKNLPMKILLSQVYGLSKGRFAKSALGPLDEERDTDERIVPGQSQWS